MSESLEVEISRRLILLDILYKLISFQATPGMVEAGGGDVWNIGVRLVPAIHLQFKRLLHVDWATATHVGRPCKNKKENMKPRFWTEVSGCV